MSIAWVIRASVPSVLGVTRFSIQWKALRTAESGFRKIMGDAGGELADRGELLDASLRLARAEELRLHPVSLGDVAADDHDRRLAGEGDAERRGLDA